MQTRNKGEPHSFGEKKATKYSYQIHDAEKLHTFSLRLET